MDSTQEWAQWALGDEAGRFHAVAAHVMGVLEKTGEPFQTEAVVTVCGKVRIAPQHFVETAPEGAAHETCLLLLGKGVLLDSERQPVEPTLSSL